MGGCEQGLSLLLILITNTDSHIIHPTEHG